MGVIPRSARCHKTGKQRREMVIKLRSRAARAGNLPQEERTQRITVPKGTVPAAGRLPRVAVAQVMRYSSSPLLSYSTGLDCQDAD